jgi:hypothetical protein
MMFIFAAIAKLGSSCRLRGSRILPSVIDRTSSPMGPANEFPTVDSGATTWHGAAEPRPTSTFERVMKAAMERLAGVSHLFVITCS